MGKVGKEIPSRSGFTEAILVIRKKRMGFKMFEEMGIKNSFENFSNDGGKSNGTVVRGVRRSPFLDAGWHSECFQGEG